MRRPILSLLVTYILGIVFFQYAFEKTATLFFIFIILMVISYIVRDSIKKYVNSSIALSLVGIFLLAGISIGLQGLMTSENIQQDQQGSVEGIAYSYNIEEGNFNQYKVTFILKSNAGKKYKVQWYTKNKVKDNITGRNVKAIGTFEIPSPKRNPNTFDYSLYLKSKGIRYILKCDKLIINRQRFKNPYLLFVNKCVTFRDKYIDILKENQPVQVAGIEKGIMFGLKDGLEDNMYEEFQKNGTAHLLATSGLHMGIIYGILSKIIRPGVRVVPNLFILFVMFCYVIMADFNSSITRAYIMIIFSVIGKNFCKQYDLLAASCGAGLIMLIYNPYLLFSAGFQMSFLAVFIMAHTLNKLKYFNIKKEILLKMLPVLIIQILMAPYIWYNFNYFSFSSFLANPPVTALGTWVLVMGSLCMSFPLAGLSVPKVLMRALTKVTEMMVKVNSFTYSHGKFTARLTSPNLAFILLLYCLLFFWLNEDVIIMYMRKNYKKITSCILVICLCCTIFAVGFRTGFEKCNMIFIDIGQGNSMLFKSDDGKTLLVDGGGKKDYSVGTKILMPALLKNGINKIDYAYVTHWDTDHYKGIEEIAKQGMVDHIITYSGNIVNRKELAEQMGVKPEQMLFLGGNDAFKVGKNISVRVLSPSKKNISDYKTELETAKENDRSLISKITVNETSFLITGDIGEDCERETVSRVGKYMKADILQVPHHGSSTSSSDELIDAVSPKVAVFQCGKNNYGHPAPEIIEKYKKKGIITYRNDLEGAIGLRIGKGNKIQIKSMIAKEENHGILQKKRTCF